LEIAIILTLLLVIQNVLTFIQVRSYRKSIDVIVSRYRGKQGYHLFSEMERRKVLPGAMVMIVVNENYIIEECHFANGLTVLSKFKELNEYKGQHVGAMLDELHGKKKTSKKVSALTMALSKVAENALISISKKNISIG
jgi:DNA-binding transcriptional regulator of glucitol operon